MPLLNDTIKYQIDNLCSDYNKYALLEFNILCTGYFLGEQHNLLEKVNIMNQTTGNVMFDYVEFDQAYYDSLEDTELYTNLQTDSNKFNLVSKYDKL